MTLQTDENAVISEISDSGAACLGETSETEQSKMNMAYVQVPFLGQHIAKVSDLICRQNTSRVICTDVRMCRTLYFNRKNRLCLSICCVIDSILKTILQSETVG
jgi:hypothetical protein